MAEEFMEKYGERLAMVIGQIFNFYIVLSMVAHTFGVDVYTLLVRVVTYPWVIPVEIIYKYWWLWEGMHYILLTLVLFDNFYFMKYYRAHKEPPPVSYARTISLPMFFLSFWLFLIYRTDYLLLLTIYSTGTVAYTWFIKK